MQTSPVPQPQRIGVPRETFPGEKREATVPSGSSSAWAISAIVNSSSSYSTNTAR